MSIAARSPRVINPCDVLETDIGRIFTPERNAEAWRRCHGALSEALSALPAMRKVVVVCGLQ